MTNMPIQPLWLTYFIEILLVLEFQLTKTYFGTFSYKAHFRPQISSNVTELCFSFPRTHAWPLNEKNKLKIDINWDTALKFFKKFNLLLYDSLVFYLWLLVGVQFETQPVKLKTRNISSESKNRK